MNSCEVPPGGGEIRIQKRILGQEYNCIMLFTRQGIKKSLLIKASQHWTHKIRFLIERNKYFCINTKIHDLSTQKIDQRFSSFSLPLFGVNQPSIKLGSHQSSMLAEASIILTRIYNLYEVVFHGYVLDSST